MKSVGSAVVAGALGFIQFEGIGGTVLSECKLVSSGFPCMCMRLPQTCTTSHVCNPGFRCVHSSLLASRTVCINCTLIDMLSKIGAGTTAINFLPVDDGPNCNTSATPRRMQSRAFVKKKAKTGFTWMKCKLDRDCAKGRRCVSSKFSSFRESCKAGRVKRCVCRPKLKDFYCSRSLGCLPGDRCVSYVIDIPLRQRICVACDYVKRAVDVVPIDEIKSCHLFWKLYQYPNEVLSHQRALQLRTQVRDFLSTVVLAIHRSRLYEKLQVHSGNGRGPLERSELVNNKAATFWW